MPPNSPRERFNNIPYFLERGCWGGAPRQGGRGKTFCVPACFSCDLNSRHFHFHDQYFELDAFGGFCKKMTHTTATRNVYWCFNFLRMKGVTPCIQDLPACGNRQDTKRNAAAELAELMRGATGLTVLALKRALLLRAATCEPASKCK